MNEFLLELVNGWQWIYADDYRIDGGNYVFVKNGKDILSVPSKRVRGVTKNPPMVMPI